MSEPRFHYFRWHSHPLGWGVRDSKHDCVVAMGDKGMCACLADLLNGVSPVKAAEVLRGYPGFMDQYAAAGAPVWRPETD